MQLCSVPSERGVFSDGIPETFGEDKQSKDQKETLYHGILQRQSSLRQVVCTRELNDVILHRSFQG